MTEKQITIKNLPTNYKVFGEETPLTGSLVFQKKPVLILHGWPSSSDKWHDVAGLLARKHIMSIIPDLPGFGKTQEPPAAWNINNYVEWLREFSGAVPELAGGFYLLGHSFGGAVCIKFAIKYNQRVEKLFLVSAACIRKQTVAKKSLSRFSKFVKLFSFLPYYDLARKAFYKFVIKKSDYTHVQGVMKETYLNVISDDLSQFVSSLKVPTVIIWGAKDTLTPLENGEFLNKKIPHSKFITIPDAGHSLEIEAPEIVTEKILENIF